MVSHRELVSHAVRRLGVGANPDLAAGAAGIDDAIARSLDLGVPPGEPLDVEPPRNWDDAEEAIPLEEIVAWWVDQMTASRRPIEERLTWFWHDHFATSAEKVETPYLMWRHVQTLRRHATGSFAELLRAVSRDAAMLLYLDGAESTAEAPNENFGREVMELHTLGVGNYTEDDVVAAARAFTGWMVNWPDDDGHFEWDAEPWAGVFVPEYHDHGSKTLLGVTGRVDMDGALDVLLDHPATAPRIAGKLHEELTGLPADAATAERLGSVLRRDWAIMPLVEAIVSSPAFTSAEAVRSKIRTPLEKVVSLRQAFPLDGDYAPEDAVWFLEALAYLPLVAPNPAGYPKGPRLLGPGQLVGSFTMLQLVAEPRHRQAEELFERLGLYDVSEQSRRVVAGAARPGDGLALAFGSPEFALT